MLTERWGMDDDEACPLCGEPFRGILEKDELRVYMSINPRFDVCKVGSRHAIHTDTADEWVTPPEYVMDRTFRP